MQLVRHIGKQRPGSFRCEAVQCGGLQITLIGRCRALLQLCVLLILKALYSAFEL